MAANNLRLIVNDMFENQFDIEEAKSLMYRTLLRKEKEPGQLDITKIGVISGFVDLNGELEVIVKFIDKIEQFTKSELYAKTTLLIEEEDND
ncbi:hypothetical protein [Litoribrevibacter albus]|uniref:Uncharacterized protein n=1 Tax=Litoribrevibacter albus TaxID=1473156 RepID=A0AA37S7J6_9GAMM|nr:hypothetical protein [Litoribrevibacter albus]GLQ29672.1 hypothetical protein GCM10007876_01500 [Litoribrevibacter albus]